MLKMARNTTFVRLVWGFMAIFLFNISADTDDFSPHSLNEDLSVNDQESFIEVIVEQVLGFEDAIAEDNNADPQHFVIKKGNYSKLQYFSHDSAIEFPMAETELAGIPINYNATLSDGHLQLELPPPKNLI
jgi:hypothetical protein